MDKLDTIFAMQKALDDDITARRHLEGIPPEEWIQKDILALIVELGEVLDEVNYKWWKNKKELSPEKLHEELIDVLHFFVSMCIRAGLDADGLYAVYQEKNKENFARQQGLSQKKGYDAAEAK